MAESMHTLVHRRPRVLPQPSRRPTLLSLMSITVCINLFAVGLIAPVWAQEPSKEYSVKAAFLFNVAKFVEWPSHTFAGSASPFALCVMGDDAFGVTLDALAGKTIQGHLIAIKRFSSRPVPPECHMLYISPQQLAQTDTLLRHLVTAPVLTVCDVGSCAESGIMLNLRLVDNHVMLELNLNAVQRTPLKVSSQLIKLTRIVKGQP